MTHKDSAAAPGANGIPTRMPHASLPLLRICQKHRHHVRKVLAGPCLIARIAMPSSTSTGLP